ncbi:MAG: large subunit ribosomal protein L25 [Gammaproteobacteria bacterium]
MEKVMAEFEVVAESRSELGKAAMRRMRRVGKVPGIVYGGEKQPVPITVMENVLRKQMENEAFFSHVLTVRVEGQGEEQAVVKALQRHPATSTVMHIDLLRVSATQSLTLTVPLHFENEDIAPGVRSGGVIAHNISEIEVSCLPANLPEFIAIDLAALELGESIHLSEVALPAGVQFSALTEDNDPAIVSIAAPRVEAEPSDDVVADSRDTGDAAADTEE